MDNDILIALLMILGSIVALAAIIATVGLAFREQNAPKQKKVKAPRTAPVLRPTSGW